MNSYYSKKGRLLFQLFLQIIILVSCGYIILDATYFLLLTLISKIFVIVVFVVSMFVILIRFTLFRNVISNKPLLLLDEIGITNITVIHPYGKIAYNDIESVIEDVAIKKKYIFIKLKASSKWEFKDKIIKHFFVQLQKSFIGYQLIIDTSRINTNYHELYQLIASKSKNT